MIEMLARGNIKHMQKEGQGKCKGRGNSHVKAPEARGESRPHSKAELSFPSATRTCQSNLHLFILALSFLSPRERSIHARRMFSSSGQKKDESSDRIVSKF